MEKNKEKANSEDTKESNMKTGKNVFLKILKTAAFTILLAIPITILAVNTELIVGDEIWNFQNVMKIVNGNKIYIDCNVITTPIFFMIGSVIVKLLGANLLGFRIYNVIIFLILLIAIYQLLKVLKIEKSRAKIYTLFVTLFLSPYISSGANYNILGTAFFIIRNCSFFKQRKNKII